MERINIHPIKLNQPTHPLVRKNINHVPPSSVETHSGLSLINICVENSGKRAEKAERIRVLAATAEAENSRAMKLLKQIKMVAKLHPKLR